MLTDGEMQALWAEEANRLIDEGKFTEAAEYLKNVANLLSPLQRRATVTTDELRLICDMTVRLTEIRQQHCHHLCVENAASKIFHKLLTRLFAFKSGMMLWFGDGEGVTVGDE